MPPKIVVVGSLNMDLIFRAPHLPRPGETVAGLSFATAAGGKGGNQAVAAARLGASVAMIGCVGDDSHGMQLRDGLMAEGIDCSGVELAAGMSTGVAMVLVAENGQNEIVIVGGANDAVTPDMVARHAASIDSAGFVLCQMEIPAETVAWTIARARKAGAKVILNPAPISRLLPTSWLKSVDYLVPNEIEAASITGISVKTIDEARTAARALRAAGAANVIVTLGAQGVLASHHNVLRHHPVRAAQAVDTTAAGDTFVGGFAAALADGRSVPDAIVYGQLAASISVTRHGAQPSIPYAREIAPVSAAGSGG